jgi:hypothetical protein
MPEENSSTMPKYNAGCKYRGEMPENNAGEYAGVKCLGRMSGENADSSG